MSEVRKTNEPDAFCPNCTLFSTVCNWKDAYGAVRGLAIMLTVLHRWYDAKLTELAFNKSDG
jgi:hypothetical protein